MVDMFHFTFVKPIEGTTARVNSNVNYGLWALMLCHCRFIEDNQWAILVRDIDRGGS